MRYLIELDTIAGTITLGTFDTIEAARKYLAGTRGRICPLWPPATAAAELIESHSPNELLKKLEKYLKQNLTTGNLYPIMDSRPHQQGRHAWESVKQ
jgi:hypothetical protein